MRAPWPPGATGSKSTPPNRKDGIFVSTCCFRSEEHTSELQSLMRISYAVFCLKKKKHNNHSDSLLIYSTNTSNSLQSTYDLASTYNDKDNNSNTSTTTLRTL